jgi:hypothetical protein
MKLAAVLFIIGIALAGCASSGAGRSWTKEEVVRWYGRGSGAERFIGYQGSDATRHHFIARVMDTWTFIHLSKRELHLSDERPFERLSSAQLYYYLIDLSRGFAKIEPKKEANQRTKPMPGLRPAAAHLNVR